MHSFTKNFYGYIGLYIIGIKFYTFGFFRRECFRATEGIPTWTGSNGFRTKKPRFGKIPKKQTSKPSNETLTAKDLLERVKERNRLMPGQNRSQFYEGQDLFQPDNAVHGFESNVELLTDVRNFIAFQNSSACDGEATTQALVKYFKDKLPPVKNPLFKALLNEICSFHKKGEHGVWRLKEEFR